MVDGRFYGLASQRIRPRNGSQIRSRKPAAGNRLPAISFVNGTGPIVRAPSEGWDQWAFAIDRRRRALLGKMDMLKGGSVRSAGNALTTLLCSASATSVLLLSYMKYYHGTRTHLSLNKDAPVPRTIQKRGRII